MGGPLFVFDLESSKLSPHVIATRIEGIEMPNSNVDTEFDGRRDRRNRFIRDHVPTAAEELTTIHIGESKKQLDKTDQFEGQIPLPSGLKKYRYATPRWKGSFAPEEQ